MAPEPEDVPETVSETVLEPVTVSEIVPEPVTVLETVPEPATVPEMAGLRIGNCAGANESVDTECRGLTSQL